MVVDPNTLDVKWHKHSDFIHQHDPDFTGNGWIGVFDNNSDFKNGEMLGGSRIVSFQPHTDSTRIRFPTPHSDPFYTTIRGKWQSLDNGNMLLTEAQSGRVVEVDPEGRTVWEWAYRPIEGQIASVSKATRHDLAREKVASWSCSSVGSTDMSAQKQQAAP